VVHEGNICIKNVSMKTNNYSLTRQSLVLCLILTVLPVNSLLPATDPEPGSITVKKCCDFQVTGEGSSDVWNNTDWVNLPRMDTGGVLYSTKVKVLYSGTGIYFLFSCEDKKLTSTLMGDYLDLYLEDVVEVFIWPDESFPVYFEYEVSPLNYELPIIIPNYNGKFFGWRPWHYEGDRLTQHATSTIGGEKVSGGEVAEWIAEFFIPFKLLVPLNNVPPVSGTKWRANMYRIDYDMGTLSFAWQKIDQSFHEYNHFGTFIFE
jgi:hypothetical protein